MPNVTARPRPALALVALSLAGAAGAAAAAGAQPPRDSLPREALPARAGSWALEGGVASDAASFGALRFLGPRSALGLDAAIGVRSETRDAAEPEGDASYSTEAVSLTLGYRRYGRLRDGLGTFGGVGATAGYQGFRQDFGSTSTTRVGVQGTFGAAYLVARRLAVNASTRLLVTRGFGSQRVPGSSGAAGDEERTDVRTWELAAGGVRLAATLFF